MAKLNWEKVEETGDTYYVYRAKVPGGWLVTAHMRDGGGITFLPDPNYTWN